MSGTRASLVATGETMASVTEVFSFLAHVPNHRLLGGRRIRVLELAAHPDGNFQGRMQLRGPFGLRRYVVTRMLYQREPSMLVGTARAGNRTTVLVWWELAPCPGRHAQVTLGAEVLSAAWIDRVILALGGRRWLAGLLQETIDRVTNPARTGAGAARRPTIAAGLPRLQSASPHPPP